MNENDCRMESRVREALDGLSMPEGLKERTLAAYDELVAKAEAAGSAEASVNAHVPVPASTPADVPSVRAVPGTAGAAAASPRRARRGWLAGLAAAACFVLALVGIGGWQLYSQPTAYVGIEVNPSIELGVNRFGVVVSQDALNDDGQELLDQVNLTGKGFSDALEALEQSEVFAAYATDDAFVAVSVSSDDEAQESELVAEGDAFVGRLPCQGQCSGVSSELREEASAAGMGVGRYRMARALIEADPSVTLEDCASMTMRELRQRLLEATGEEIEGGCGMGMGSGSGSQGNAGSGGPGSGMGGHGGWGRGGGS